MRRWWRRWSGWREMAMRCARDRGRARQQLLGPVRATLQSIRGMCTDAQAHEAIDAKLAELDELIYETAQALRP